MSPSASRRFFAAAAVAPCAGGFTVTLDGRALRTPGRRPFVVPSAALAAAAAAEWMAQGAEIAPRTMPLTGLANAAIDRVATDPQRFVGQVAGYGASDLVCYRAEAPLKLVARQAAMFDPLVTWIAERHGARLQVVTGVMPHAQPPEALAAIARAVEAFPPFPLAALAAAVTLLGSVVLGLALAEGRLDAAGAWAAAQIDETTQGEDWGVDAEAAARAARMFLELAAAARFLDLLKASPTPP